MLSDFAAARSRGLRAAMAMMKAEASLELKNETEADNSSLAELEVDLKAEAPDLDLGDDESKVMEIHDKWAAESFLLNAFTKRVIEEHGGPMQYLRFVHGEDGKAFAAELRQVFPYLDSVNYGDPGLLHCRERCITHISNLGFSEDCTSKPPPYGKVCLALAEDILQNGFLTDTEPLILWLSATDKQTSLEDYKAKYVKGMARVTTMLALVTLALRSKLDMLLLPEFTSSVQAIHCCYQPHTDLTSVAIANAHHSNRGAIRQQHDLITWVCKLKRLQSAAHVEPKWVLDKFNSTATSKGRVAGTRRQSALNLMTQACHSSVSEMLKFVSTYGVESVWWHEDTFTNRKLLPGFQSRSNKPLWNDILLVTEDSMHFMVMALNTQQALKIHRMRRQWEKNRIEEMSALCAMWTWCLKRAKDHGIADDALLEMTDKFLEADVALVLDLQNLLHEKKNDFSFTDVKCFHEVMKHKVTCTDMVVSGSAKTELEASKFEEMEFNLMCQKLEADMQAVQIYRSKSECHESRLYHFRQEHLRKRRCQAREAVATLWTGGPSRPMAFVNSLHEFLAYITDARKEHLIPTDTALPVVMVANWCAPSTIRESQLALQIEALQALSQLGDVDSMALILMPVWERTKGQIYKSENILLTKLAERQVNVDDRASLSFEECCCCFFWQQV